MGSRPFGVSLDKRTDRDFNALARYNRAAFDKTVHRIASDIVKSGKKLTVDTFYEELLRNNIKISKGKSNAILQYASWSNPIGLLKRTNKHEICVYEVLY